MRPDGVPIDRATRIERAVWAALLLSQFGYGALAYTGPGRIAPAGDLPLLPWVFAALALCAAGAAHAFWRRATPSSPSPVVPAPPSASGAGARIALPLRIVTWALDESIALLGLVLALLGHAPAVWLPFFAVALAAMFLHRPS